MAVETTHSSARHARMAREPMGRCVLILLATCNGEKFVREQVASIICQSFVDWRLLIRDDDSSDSTRALLQTLARTDARIQLVDDGLGRLGAVGNFNRLLLLAAEQGADYCFLADQDDVWTTHKVTRQLAAMKDAELAYGHDEPILVHSDLEVVDDALRTVHLSFLRYCRIRHEPEGALRTLLVQNFVTGATCLVNRRLLELATPIPAEAVMHDWWLALVASAIGQIAFLNDATVRYRQHSKNTIGAVGFWKSVNPLRKSWNPRSAAGLRPFLQTLEQARALKRRIMESMVSTDRPCFDLVDEYCRLFETHVPRIRRALRVRRLGIGRQEPIRNAALLLRLLLTSTRNFNTQAIA